MYEIIGIDKKMEELAKESEKEIQTEFKQIEQVCQYNSLKVLKAFQDNHISCLLYTSDAADE